MESKSTDTHINRYIYIYIYRYKPFEQKVSLQTQETEAYNCTDASLQRQAQHDKNRSREPEG